MVEGEKGSAMLDEEIYDGGRLTLEDLMRKREAILHVAAQYGASQVRVFGSVARGEADAASDVDFLVEFALGRSLFDLGGLLMALQTLLGRRVDVVTANGLRERMRERVLQEAVPL